MQPCRVEQAPGVTSIRKAAARRAAKAGSGCVDEVNLNQTWSSLALVAVSGATMAGVHVTLADRNRLGEVVVALRNFIGGDATLYVVGPTTDYNMPALGNVRGFEPHCYVDVRAHLTGGLEFYVRPMGGAGAWQRLDMALFN